MPRRYPPLDAGRVPIGHRYAPPEPVPCPTCGKTFRPLDGRVPGHKGLPDPNAGGWLGSALYPPPPGAITDADGYCLGSYLPVTDRDTAGQSGTGA
jgi:hypothetical protein